MLVGPGVAMVIGLPLLSVVGAGLIPLFGIPAWFAWWATEPAGSLESPAA